MKKYLLLLITLTSGTLLFSQETNDAEPLSLELSLRYEKTGFNRNYSSYFWADGNYGHLSETGNKAHLGAKISYLANLKNTMFLGLGYNLHRAESGRERVNMSFLDLELGHRFNVFRKSDFNVHLENSLSFGINNDINKYGLKGTFLDLRIGFHMEKSLYEKLNLFFGLNYGVGLLTAWKFTNESPLRTTVVGLKMGMRIQL